MYKTGQAYSKFTRYERNMQNETEAYDILHLAIIKHSHCPICQDIYFSYQS